MRKLTDGRLTYANVVSTLALFLVLGGGAYAAARIDSDDIKNRAVIASKIDPKAVISAKLDDDAVNSRSLADNAVTTNKIAREAVKGAKIDADSVGDRALRDGAVTNPKIDDGAVDARTLGEIVVVEAVEDNVGVGEVGTATAICPDNSIVISGGGFPSSFQMELTTSVRFGNNWRVQARNDTGEAQTLTARANCLIQAP